MRDSFVRTWHEAVHGYDTIPEEEVFDPPVKKDKENGLSVRTCRLLILPLSLLGILAMASLGHIGANWTDDAVHQETPAPSLLSVIDPETKTLLNPHSNPVYQTLTRGEWVILEHSSNQRLYPGDELPSLFLDKPEIESGGSVTVTWTVGRDVDSGDVWIHDDDIIALFCDNTDHFLEAATIAQVRATSRFNGGPSDSWYIPTFPDLRQNRCHFEYLVLYQNIVISVAKSEHLEILEALESPTAIHLALTGDPTSMIVQFTTGEIANTTPAVRFSESGGKQWDFTMGTTDTYGADDMCQAPANLTEAGKFYPPGNIHTVRLENLIPNANYVYQVGLIPNNSKDKSALVWSNEHTFRAPPRIGDKEPVKFIVYGDQGCPHLGWKGGAKWLQSMKDREGHISAIHHFGDISYSNGASHVWDGWFDMIHPISTSFPLMVAVGNHEYDHVSGGLNKDPSGVTTDHGFMPEWGDFGDDSRGECGVTTSKRFQMPASEGSNGVFWYSFDYGMVHTIVMSSEHDASPGSPQHAFLEADLQRVDREVTPWVILETHRPLYESEGSGKWWASHVVGEHMREEFEDLLLQYQVDLVLAGHYHEYHRTCDGLYRGKCDRGGPTHITVGSAGGRLDDGYNLDNHWTAHFIKGEYGYGRMTVPNSTHLHFQFVLHGYHGDGIGGEVDDHVWIHRERS